MLNKTHKSNVKTRDLIDHCNFARQLNLQIVPLLDALHHHLHIVRRYRLGQVPEVLQQFAKVTINMSSFCLPSIITA